MNSEVKNKKFLDERRDNNYFYQLFGLYNEKQAQSIGPEKIAGLCLQMCWNLGIDSK